MQELIEEAAKEIARSRYAIALTGAGISTESGGVADFRGPSGLWVMDKEAESKAYQRYELFLTNPKAYWEEMMQEATGTPWDFYRQLREAESNSGHKALADLQRVAATYLKPESAGIAVLTDPKSAADNAETLGLEIIDL